jgi:hypothetical protein
MAETVEKALAGALRKVMDDPRSHPNLRFKAIQAYREVKGLKPMETEYKAAPDEILPTEGLQRLMKDVEK